ncbi:MAG TPA: DUF1549 domain-containing protein, partial [Verrucomicrobiae bacterium]|nr:DUF1549 domain-containing protein [Verrucomicrobiae bacterium]
MTKRSIKAIFVGTAVLISALLFPSFAADPVPPISFDQQVRPIFEQYCYKCHSAQAEKVKGGLLLDTPEGMRRGGDTGAVLAPGDPDNSKIVIAVRHSDPDLRMPPKEKLSDDQINLLERWVKEGAPDPRATTAAAAHKVKQLWSTQPIRKVQPPARRPGTPGDDLDSFLLAELQKHKIPRVGPADKRTLLRRATFDLLGLPPSPQEIADFLRDDSRESFARVVDRLLDSPHFGERWGRHWLDV